MPWYAPSLRAPPTPHRTDNDDNGDLGWNEEAVDLQNCLDESWNYASSSFARASGPSSENDGQQQQQPAHARGTSGNCLKFDGFQHQVESQLAGVFPLADFSSSSNNYSAQNNLRQSSSLHCDSSMHYGSLNPFESGGDYGQSSQNEHPNLTTEGGGGNNNSIVVSKAAQFFHPRPVMALMPYRNFFSPLQFPNDDKSSLGGETAVGGRKQPSLGTQDLSRVGNNNNQLLSQRETFHARDPRRETTFHNSQVAPQNGHVKTTPAEHNDRNNLAQTLGPSQEVLGNNSGLKPADLFGAAVFDSNPFKQPPKQAKLVQDAKTGQMATSLESSKLGEKKKAKTWNDYGGRPVDDESKNDNNQRKEKTKEKKKKDKKKKKDNSKGKSDMASYLNNGEKRPSNDSEENIASKRKKPEATKMKKQKRERPLFNSGTELEIPVYDEEVISSPDENASPTITENDFDGIEQMELQNAAQCMEGLFDFLSKVGRQKHVSFSIVFLDPHTGNYTTSCSVSSDDVMGGGKKKKKKAAARSNKYTQNANSSGYECTTPFLPTSKSYCTAKGPKCTAWNCTCDGQIRAMRASATLLGAMFVFQDMEGGEGDNAPSGGGGWECFLLPLGPTNESSSTQQELEYKRMEDWPVIPFHCDVSLSDRWSAFEAILLNSGTKLVTYNATVSLLPFYRHLDDDIPSQSHCGGRTFSQFAACLSGKNFDTESQGQLLYGSLRSIWDLRLVSWMLRPHATDSELEFSAFQAGFAHIVEHQKPPSSDMPTLMQGLADAKNNLEFIHSLYPIMNTQLADGGLLGALEHIEAPVQSILSSMESRGIGFYPPRLKKIENDLVSRIEQLETQSQSITGDPDFLLSSPQQVSAFLFDVLKLSIPAGPTKTKAGSSHRSTSQSALNAIKAEMTSRTGSSPQIIDIILEFRGLNKLLTTYIRPLPKVCRRVKRKKNSPARIYPQWMQTAVRTGRLSCRKPNLQQIPNAGAFGVVPRDAFVTEEGLCLFACDYSQKEVRILAHMSGDEALISLFRGDPKVDIYKQMSSLIRNKPITEISDVERAQFKQVTLAILYGMSPNQVAKNLSISKSNAQQMINAFFRRFRRVKAWMDETKTFARRNSYVKTIAGRKRFLDDINSDDNSKSSEAERQAINTVIQGSAADLMKKAMINMQTTLTMHWRDDVDPIGTSNRPRMILQIHDEVILEVRFNERDIKRLQTIAQKSCCLDCEDFFGLKVPLLLKCSAGRKWGAMKEFED
ncbi:hypothetical protein ACHAXR_011673 [Thalassiosira sp. AJA248-18]